MTINTKISKKRHKTYKTHKTHKTHKNTYKSRNKKSLILDPIQLTLNLKTTNNDNANNDYKTIFSNKNILKDIIFLKKQSFEIFYSCKYKYPLLVKEELNFNTGKGDIKRKDIGDPWNIDNIIPLKCHYTKGPDFTYSTYDFYGGSPGHNAPASWHKLNINDYKETYLNTNITPQNVNLNTGLWNLLEMWSKLLIRHKDISNINIFTGSIPNTTSSLLYNAKLEKIEMNIPTNMFKIICFYHSKYPNITFIDIFLFNNKTYNINFNIKPNINFIKYVLPIKSYHWFENKLGINIINLLKFYNINSNNIKSFKNLINLNITLTEQIKNYMSFNILITKYIESKTLDELYTHYDLKVINNNIFCKSYFYKIRNKLIRDKLLYTKFTTLNLFNKFFNNFKNDINTIYNIEDKDFEAELLDIDQDTYLNNYYNLVKQKLVK
jgi:DNA/RNA endonuclease G (NUC1)